MAEEKVALITAFAILRLQIHKCIAYAPCLSSNEPQAIKEANNDALRKPTVMPFGFLS